MTNSQSTDRAALADELLPCPFCGTQPTCAGSADDVAIMCGNESCRLVVGVPATTKVRAFKQWNTRSPSPYSGAAMTWQVRKAESPVIDDDYPAENYFEVLCPGGNWRGCVAVDANDARDCIQKQWAEEHPTTLPRDAEREGEPRPSRIEVITALKAAQRNFMATGASRESDGRYEDMADSMFNLFRARDAERETIERCDWPAAPFTFHNEPGEHDPCYVVVPGGAMLSLNHHAGEGVDIARAKFIVAACNAALQGQLPFSPAHLQVIVTEAMLDSWNDICSDTGCHPLDIEQVGKRRLEFHVGHWARQTGARVAQALSPSPTSVMPDRKK